MRNILYIKFMFFCSMVVYLLYINYLLRLIKIDRGIYKSKIN